MSTYPTITICPNTDLAPSNPPQVKEREHGATVQLPVVRVGTGHAEAGDVAALIMDLPFKKARIRVDSEAFKHPSLEAMHGLTYKREPFLRPTNT